MDKDGKGKREQEGVREQEEQRGRRTEMDKDGKGKREQEGVREQEEQRGRRNEMDKDGEGGSKRNREMESGMGRVSARSGSRGGCLAGCFGVGTECPGLVVPVLGRERRG
ncbi:Uncharacterised protein r2_g3324 [Pycnogonum litorale]